MVATVVAVAVAAVVVDDVDVDAAAAAAVAAVAAVADGFLAIPFSASLPVGCRLQFFVAAGVAVVVSGRVIFSFFHPRVSFSHGHPLPSLVSVVNLAPPFLVFFVLLEHELFLLDLDDAVPGKKMNKN